MHIPHWPKIPIWKIPRRLDLSKILKLLNALGNPQNKLPPTIHIAGTNGKGSSLAMIKAIFMQAGYKVHSYTSPHLINFNERIELGNNQITDSHLSNILERVKTASEKINIEPTFFEGTTAAAFLAFSETPADILLLETGLGGRLDCTNVITNPIATLITPISYDHMEYLGNKITEIANEKAGIIKRNAPCIIGPQSDEVYPILFDKCRKMHSPSFCYEYEFGIEKIDNGFRYLSKKFNLEFPLPNLNGDHQIQNASSVIATIILLNEKFKITSNQIKAGLLNVNWPGRIQLLNPTRTENLIGHNKVKIYLDGAHNDDGAFALSNWIKNNIKGKVYLILGMTRNRNVVSFCNFFRNSIHGGSTINVKSEPSSYNASILAAKAKDAGLTLKAAESLDEAINHINNLNKKEPATIIVTGSLFLVSDFLKLNYSK